MNNLRVLGGASAFFVSLAGVSGTPYGVHYFTSQTVSEGLEQESTGKKFFKQDDKNDEQWKAIQKRLNLESSTPKTHTLVQIKITKGTDGEALKKWCIESSRTTYKSALVSAKKDLRKDVQEFCVYKIKDKIGLENLMDVNKDNYNDSADWKPLLDKVKEHVSTKKKDKLPENLENIKEKISTKTHVIKHNLMVLKEWCKWNYEMPFKGDSKGNWELASKFCKKVETKKE